jgi:hypothetical protein
MSSESVCQVVRSWVYVSSFHERLVVRFMIFSATVRDILDWPCNTDRFRPSCKAVPIITRNKAGFVFRLLYFLKNYFKVTFNRQERNLRNSEFYAVSNSLLKVRSCSGKSLNQYLLHNPLVRTLSGTRFVLHGIFTRKLGCYMEL